MLNGNSSGFSGAERDRPQGRSWPLQIRQLTQHLHTYLIRTLQSLVFELDRQPKWIDPGRVGASVKAFRSPRLAIRLDGRRQDLARDDPQPDERPRPPAAAVRVAQARCTAAVTAEQTPAIVASSLGTDPDEDDPCSEPWHRQLRFKRRFRRPKPQVVAAIQALLLSLDAGQGVLCLDLPGRNARFICSISRLSRATGSTGGELVVGPSLGDR